MTTIETRIGTTISEKLGKYAPGSVDSSAGTIHTHRILMKASVCMEEVHHRYGLGPTSTLALRDIQLSISPGESVAIWGPSGSGKSTMCNLAGGLLLATRGRVWVNGHDLADMPDDERASFRCRQIGFVFQQFHLIPVFSALENVALPLMLQGSVRARAEREALALLTALGLRELVHKRPDLLSGGEQQRVAVARALVHRPSMLIADEPTANLDSDNAERVMDLMTRLHRDLAVTLLFATHDDRLIARAGRRIRLADGRIALDTGAVR